MCSRVSVVEQVARLHGWIDSIVRLWENEVAMSENPYRSPTDRARILWLRPWRVVIVVALFLIAVLGPITWQAMREKAVRDRAIQNLRQLGHALEQYQARQPGTTSFETLKALNGENSLPAGDE